MFFSHSPRVWEARDQCGSRVCVWWVPLSLGCGPLPSHHVLAWLFLGACMRKEISLPLLVRPLIPTNSNPTLWPHLTLITSEKPFPQNHCGVRASTYEFRRETILSIASPSNNMQISSIPWIFQILSKRKCSYSPNDGNISPKAGQACTPSVNQLHWIMFKSNHVQLQEKVFSKTFRWSFSWQSPSLFLCLKYGTPRTLLLITNLSGSQVTKQQQILTNQCFMGVIKLCTYK